jgi:hypothetical protein
VPNWRQRFPREARQAYEHLQLTEAEFETLLEANHRRLETACAREQGTD